jgi:endonuclease/exonuclease/phosphatase family metal-dependent hydrolase
MPDLSVLFWNIQYWGARDKPVDEARRFDRVMDLIRVRNPDVACFAEVKGDTIHSNMARALPPGYTIHQTAVDNGFKILTLFKNASDRSIIITQKDEFKGPKGRGKPYPLIRVFMASHDISIIPIHTKSGARAEDLVIRNEIVDTACKIACDLRAQGSKIIIMGDMNTMGAGAVPFWQEIKSLKQKFHDCAGLVPLYKTHPTTWHGIGSDSIYPDAELDHVFVDRQLMPNILPMHSNGAQLWIGGWALEPDYPSRDLAVQEISDHTPVLFTMRF